VDATELTVTWVGHATVLVEIAGVRLVTDPALTRRLAHLVRRRPAPELAPVDAVLISHAHMDHLHIPSLRRLGERPTLAVPAGAGRLVRRVATSEVLELRAGDGWDIAGPHGDVEVRATAADHSGRRGPHSRVDVDPLGFVITSGGRRVYFAGDTDLFDGMADLGPLDVALVPIWGWGSTLGERHLDPDRAVRAVELLDPTVVIPVHWGTYSPQRARRGDPAWLERPLAQFRDALAARNLDDRLVALQPGESWSPPSPDAGTISG
jgi:L-ascorbate metabolism protein UlaG (beta-lactamase superfamily)